MLAFSSVPSMELRLPAGDDTNSLVHIIGYVRDTLDCVTEFNVSSVVVVTDSEGINNLIDILQTSSSTLTNNPLVQILASGNQNMVGQVISSLSLVFNKINNQTVENAVASEDIHYDLNFLKI
jgi:hypothetical protein